MVLMALGGASTSSGGTGTSTGGRGRGRGRGRGGARGRSDVGDRERGEAMGRGDGGDIMHIENGGRVDEEDDIAVIVESLQRKASQGDFHKRPINGVKLGTVHFIDGCIKEAHIKRLHWPLFDLFGTKIP
ncbi:uncharacterized protein LOC141717161 [Apium graveolens]|uniref:uncharacterized protein LOC141717161 n=1 Tax=Apium graveolens TaxID=4045 RepID=UPI003D7BBCEF